MLRISYDNKSKFSSSIYLFGVVVRVSGKQPLLLPKRDVRHYERHLVPQVSVVGLLRPLLYATWLNLW